MICRSFNHFSVLVLTVLFSVGAVTWVGGKALEFIVAGAVDSKPVGVMAEGRTVQIIDRRGDVLVQPLLLTLDSSYVEPVEAVLHVDGQVSQPLTLKFGKQTESFMITACEKERKVDVFLEIGGAKVMLPSITVKPAVKRTIYVLPHSHTDIGYTALQTDIEERQINNLLLGMAEARRTADYPPGSRFVWNVEVLWSVDLFLQRLPEARRAEFYNAVKSGQVALNGMYLNELTGLCRPEELIRLFRCATQLGEQTGMPVTSAMISDVPGYTWGTVTAMAQAGIRYFSVAPNYFDRIGDILVQWENKPFWWIGPDGQSKVLVWIPYQGYATSHIHGKLSPAFVEKYCADLEQRNYPYDIAYLRWAGHGDNAVPDTSICDAVREWNAMHVWPQLVIAATSEAFSAFEQKYGEKLPQVRGDWSPYWEDGAGSSAAETALNRASSERLRQAETLWALLEPKRYPTQRFAEAWNNVLLYSEHTWGAHCSISQPGIPFTTDQWAIKQSYAVTANLQSRQLLNDAAQVVSEDRAQKVGDKVREESVFVDVFNVNSWPRTEVVLLPAREVSDPRNSVTDLQGAPVPSQRLASGELAILVSDLPPFAGRRYQLSVGQGSAVVGSLKVDDATIENDKVSVRLDRRTGGIVELRATGIDLNLADTNSGHVLNDYLYLVGDDITKLQSNGPVKITVRDHGPLVASLLVESDAPGCHRLYREIRLTANGDFVELFNRVDKKRLEANSYHDRQGKESVNFAFPFNVPGGEIRLDVPFGVFRPEIEQLPGACKNWLTVNSWADVANKSLGVTWVTLDAPLVQVGGITANLLNSQTNPEAWRKKIEPTQKLYAWVMNNHWGTNYRAYQEGPVTFRFVLRPHGVTTVAETTRFAVGRSQPLLALPARGLVPDMRSLLNVAPADVLVTALKPSDDGQALIIRLFNTGAEAAEAKLSWGRKEPRRFWVSDTSERPIQRLSTSAALMLPASGLVTVRVEF